MFLFDFLQKLLLGFLQKFFALFGTPVRASRLKFFQDFLLGYFQQFLQKILFLVTLIEFLPGILQEFILGILPEGFFFRNFPQNFMKKILNRIARLIPMKNTLQESQIEPL